VPPLFRAERGIDCDDQPDHPIAVSFEVPAVTFRPVGIAVGQQPFEFGREACRIVAEVQGFAQRLLPESPAFQPALGVATQVAGTVRHQRTLILVQRAYPAFELAAQALLTPLEPLLERAACRLLRDLPVLVSDAPEHPVDLLVVERPQQAGRFGRQLSGNIVPEPVQIPAGGLEPLTSERFVGIPFELAKEGGIAIDLRLTVPQEQGVDRAFELLPLAGIQVYVIAEVPRNQDVEPVIHEARTAAACEQRQQHQRKQRPAIRALDGRAPTTANRVMTPGHESLDPLAAACAGLLLVAACMPVVAVAANRVEVHAGSIESGGIRAHGVELVLIPASGTMAELGLYAAGLDGLETPGRLSGLRLECVTLEAAGGRANCSGGRISGEFGDLGPQDTAIEIALEQDGTAKVRAPALRLAGGSAALEGRVKDTRWSVRLDPRDVGLASLADLADGVPDGLSVSGRVSGTVDASGLGTELDKLSAQLRLDSVGFADAAGALAGEQLAAGLTLAIWPRAAGNAWDFEADLELTDGQAYVEPVFMDFGEHALTGKARGSFPADVSRVTVDRLDIMQAGIATVGGSAQLDLAGDTLLERALLRFDPIDLAGAVPVYAAPMLISTQYADLAAAGSIRGEAEVEAGLPVRLQFVLHDVVLDSPTGALSVDGLSGEFSWFGEQQRNELAPQVDSEVFKSRLDWRAARLWGIEFGPASVPFTTTGRHFRLLDPILIPVFDGGIEIETLRIRHAGTPQMYLRFDAEVRPVSVALIGRALGWPEFSGTISGRIPRLELADGLVTFGGNIEARVFDGIVTLRDLKMRDPLGQYPQLFADIDIDALDLERITNTFEFGMITGRLSGRVKGLEMFAWMPVRLDARLYSTPGDRSPHRISQRAVSNLSSIGGGSGGSVTAALQSGFLRFFDSFRYDRLGLSCRLANDVCLMDGVQRAQNGYYIVKGSGLPRIDVIGSQRRVAWTRLVRQLGAITQSSGPVVE